MTAPSAKWYFLFIIDKLIWVYKKLRLACPKEFNRAAANVQFLKEEEWSDTILSGPLQIENDADGVEFWKE